METASCLEAVRGGFAQRAKQTLPPSSALHAWLADLWSRGQTTWPEVKPNPIQFGHQLAVGFDNEEAIHGNEPRHAEDLYLACGCVAQDTVAVNRVVSEYGPLIRTVAGRFRQLVDRDDAESELLGTLFYPTPSRPPKLASYAGRGALSSWLRSTASHLMIDRVRQQKDRKEHNANDSFLERLGPVQDGELGYLKAAYRADFRDAFYRAWQKLAPADRNLLRFRYLDQLPVEDIASMQSVHRATVFRRLQAATSALLDHTRSNLRDKLEISDSECRSLIRLVQSNAGLSLHNLLTTRPG